MGDLYPELRGYVVDAEALMTYIFDQHQHDDRIEEGSPFVMSLALERWLRDNARRKRG